MTINTAKYRLQSPKMQTLTAKSRQYKINGENVKQHRESLHRDTLL